MAQRNGGIYNAQAKDLCTTQTCAFCGPKSNLDRSYIIILMPTVEICLDWEMGDLLPQRERGHVGPTRDPLLWLNLNFILQFFWWGLYWTWALHLWVKFYIWAAKFNILGTKIGNIFSMHNFIYLLTIQIQLNWILKNLKISRSCFIKLDSCNWIWIFWEK